MNVSNLFRIVKDIASKVKTVRSVYDGDVYSIWNTEEVKYASFVVGLNYASKDNNTRIYNLILYYGDRLLQDNSNRNAVVDDAMNTLQTVINKLNEYDEIECNSYTMRPFEQKFLDYIGGAYVEVDVYVEDELGHCDINDIVTEDEDLIEQLKQAIREYEQKDAQLSGLLKEILHKISGEIIE